MFSSGSPPVLGYGYISQRLYSVKTHVQVAKLPPFHTSRSIESIRLPHSVWQHIAVAMRLVRVPHSCIWVRLVTKGINRSRIRHAPC
jgi:hypothetical protein